MVLYHKDGRVIKAHEDYLEQAAAELATTEGKQYEEQINICKMHDPDARKNECNVEIVVDSQFWRMLYYWNTDSLGEEIHTFERSKSVRITTGIKRATLMRCSSLADEVFRYNTDGTELHLPVLYPRKHVQGEYVARPDNQLAYIRPREIHTYILPWLRKMQNHFEKQAKTETNAGYDPVIDIDDIEIPESLLEKIHLYNAMLQLGLPSFIQRPLIDELVAQIYKTNLNACELDTLEITVGRFYSRGVAILDPVLCHFVGTYSFRNLQDRQNPEPTRPY